jgi:hypothetical protein
VIRAPKIVLSRCDLWLPSPMSAVEWCRLNLTHRHNRLWFNPPGPKYALTVLETTALRC